MLISNEPSPNRLPVIEFKTFSFKGTISGSSVFSGDLNLPLESLKIIGILELIKNSVLIEKKSVEILKILTKKLLLKKKN